MKLFEFSRKLGKQLFWTDNQAKTQHCMYAYTVKISGGRLEQFSRLRFTGSFAIAHVVAAPPPPIDCFLSPSEFIAGQESWHLGLETLQHSCQIYVCQEYPNAHSTWSRNSVIRCTAHREWRYSVGHGHFSAVICSNDVCIGLSRTVCDIIITFAV